MQDLASLSQIIWMWSAKGLMGMSFNVHCCEPRSTVAPRRHLRGPTEVEVKVQSETALIAKPNELDCLNQPFDW